MMKKTQHYAYRVIRTDCQSGRPVRIDRPEDSVTTIIDGVRHSIA
jgi:hypothetical protein